MLHRSTRKGKFEGEICKGNDWPWFSFDTGFYISVTALKSVENTVIVTPSTCMRLHHCYPQWSRTGGDLPENTGTTETPLKSMELLLIYINAWEENQLQCLEVGGAGFLDKNSTGPRVASQLHSGKRDRKEDPWKAVTLCVTRVGSKLPMWRGEKPQHLQLSCIHHPLDLIFIWIEHQHIPLISTRVASTQQCWKWDL